MATNNIKHILNTRYFDIKKDYDILCAWYEKYDQVPLRTEQYPPTGLVVEVDTAPVCSGFLWRTDSVIGVFSMPIVDRDAEKEQRNLALNHLIESIKVQAKAIGIKWIFCPVNSKSFLKRLRDLGFKIYKSEGWFEV